MDNTQVENKVVKTENKRINKNSNVIKELTEIQVDVKSFKLGDIIIPLLSLIILVLLSVFVYIPMISEATKNNAQSKDIDNKITQLKSLSKQLDSIDQGQMQVDLANSRLVIPYSLQVSDFIINTDKQALDSGLKAKDILAGDVQINDGSTKKSTKSASIMGVSGPVKYEGSIVAISNFLDKMTGSSQYILSLENIRLKKQANNGDKWEVSLSVTGYYLNKDTVVSPSYYIPFSAYTRYADVFSKFANKVESNNK